MKPENMPTPTACNEILNLMVRIKHIKAMIAPVNGNK
tara:strand:+ start:602 stop:712 length:111 start_codon:yes stop_codon:yes gene_type:complete